MPFGTTLKPMVTIIDVARAAGVAPSTVSHVLNSKRPISLETKKRVYKAIEDLGYEPNPNAQALRNQSSGIIGFYASDITELFSTSIIQGVERATTQKNCHIVFASGTEFGDDIEKATHFLMRRRIDGLIISFGIRRALNLDFIDQFKIPLVVVNAKVDRTIPSVQPDDRGGGRSAAQYLLNRGAHSLAIIAGPENRISSEDRVAGFLEELEAQNIACDFSKRIVHGNYTVESGEQCFASLFKRDPSIDAIFCANDYMAAGAINAALARGLTIPDRIKIIGFDNREFCSFWPTPITTFALPLLKMGEKSAEILLQLVEGKALLHTKITIPSELVIRKSG